jgi:hypothetical protein
MYLDDILQKWKNKARTGINTLLFTDDLVAIFDKEERLQRSLPELNEISKEHNMGISKKEKNVMAFYGKYPIRTKIIIDNNPIEEI